MVITALDHVPHCYSAQDGMVIAQILRNRLSQDGVATLSFAGVSDVPSSFVNAALVSLLDTYQFDWIKAHLTIVDASHQTADMVRRCFNNAIQQLRAA
jgi:hypothetical protein